MAVEKDDEYKNVAFYAGNTTAKETGFSFFEVENAFYFCRYLDGNIVILSWGYTSAVARDAGIESLKNNQTLAARYVFESRGPNRYGFSITEANGKKIAISSDCVNLTAAKDLSRRLINSSTSDTLGVLTAATSEGDKNPSEVEPVAVFETFSAGLAEAAAKAAAMTPEPVVDEPTETPIAAPAPISNTSRSWDSSSSGSSGVWSWLKWLLLVLLTSLAVLFLFKACAVDPKNETTKFPPKTNDVVPTTAVIICWDNTEVTNESACPAKVTCWDDSFAVSLAECPVQFPLESFECWDGSQAVNLSECPSQSTGLATENGLTNKTGTLGSVETSVPESPTKTDDRATPAGTIIAATVPKISVGNKITGQSKIKMTAPSVAGRFCGPSSNILFNVTDVAPNQVGYLGSNPQFGESLSLTPDGFYRKLATAYRINSKDRDFLDLLARSLGYGSFREMDSSMFSDDQLPNGSSGLLGFGTEHKLQYSVLNVTDVTDLEAFKVRSVNGTDIHFMKRCGNYMYVCQP